jgi:hypothetical protein
MNAGLRLDQGPPFAIPLAFFLVAPLFMSAAGMLIALNWDSWSATRWSPTLLAITHLITIGYLGMAMVGAFTQMAPVTTGGPLPRVVGVGRTSHGLILVGAPLLAWGFAGARAALVIGAMACTLAFLLVVLSGLIGLARAPVGPTRGAMRLALLALLGVVTLGLGLVAGLVGLWSGPSALPLVEAHAILGLTLWIGLLVAGSAYQVVPMLQITPNYPSWMTRHFAPVLATLGFAVSVAAQFPVGGAIVTVLVFGLASLLALFALVTLDLQRRRRRKIGDATLWYWRLGLLCLLAAVMLVIAPMMVPDVASDHLEVLAGLCFLLGFASSMVNGMLLKIVPFLAWFHAQAQAGLRQVTPISMKHYFPDAAARHHFLVHLGALALLAPSPWLPALSLPGGALLALSGAHMAWRFVLATRLYRTQGGHFWAR